MTLYDLYKKGTDVGVMWQDGRPFNHPYAIRLNLALPKSKVIEAFERLDKYVFWHNRDTPLLLGIALVMEECPLFVKSIAVSYEIT